MLSVFVYLTSTCYRLALRTKLVKLSYFLLGERSARRSSTNRYLTHAKLFRVCNRSTSVGLKLAVMPLSGIGITPDST